MTYATPSDLVRAISDSYARHPVRGTYAQVCTFMERIRSERRKRYVDLDCYHELARQMGLDVSEKSMFEETFYRRSSIYDFLLGLPSPPRDTRMTESDVAATQRSRSQR